MNLGRLARAALSTSMSGRGSAALNPNAPALAFSRDFGVSASVAGREWYPDPYFLESLKSPVLVNNG